MGCFLGCFGGSKDRKRRKQRNKVLPRDKQSISHQNDVLTKQRVKDSSPSDLVSDLRDKFEEKSSSSSKKRVTFDSNVKTYEHISLYESNDSLPETAKVDVTDKEIEEIAAKVKEPLLPSGESAVASRVGSFPPNYRYQNCRDSDDEIEECGESDSEDIDDYDYEEDYFDDDDSGVRAFVGPKELSESVLTASMESRTENLSTQPTKEEVESPIEMPIDTAKDVINVKPPGNARDRSDYVHPVLNPVENLTQWKTVKSRGTSHRTPEKENLRLESETADISFSSEPIVKRSSSRVKPKSAQYDIPPNDEAAVDASLSTWLTASESSPSKTNSGLETVTSEKFSNPQSSNSVWNLEDRPILGALTIEELKQLSKSSSPRRSPGRSPDEMPIIGTVGTYWNDIMAEKDSRSIPSYKGIPNTTSKYREDKKVNWHSTPFEKRLEQALNGGSGEA